MMTVVVQEAVGGYRIYMTCIDSVDDVKAKVHTQRGYPPHQQRLYFAGLRLENGRTLSEYNLPTEPTLLLLYEHD